MRAHAEARLLCRPRMRRGSRLSSRVAASVLVLPPNFLVSAPQDIEEDPSRLLATGLFRSCRPVVTPPQRGGEFYPTFLQAPAPPSAGGGQPDGDTPGGSGAPGDAVSPGCSTSGPAAPPPDLPQIWRSLRALRAAER